jgi:hypothetical protein
VVWFVFTDVLEEPAAIAKGTGEGQWAPERVVAEYLRRAVRISEAERGVENYKPAAVSTPSP